MLGKKGYVVVVPHIDILFDQLAAMSDFTALCVKRNQNPVRDMGRTTSRISHETGLVEVVYVLLSLGVGLPLVSVLDCLAMVTQALEKVRRRGRRRLTSSTSSTTSPSGLCSHSLRLASSFHYPF